jgi:hypothetical protein
MNTTAKTKYSIWVEVIAAMFILLFLYTAMNNVIYMTPRIVGVSFIPLLSKSPMIITWAVIVLEFVAALMLFIRRTRKAGFYLTFGLMTLHTAYVGYMLYTVSIFPKSFGTILPHLAWKPHLFLNSTLLLISLLAILLMRIEMKTQAPEVRPIVFT